MRKTGTETITKTTVASPFLAPHEIITTRTCRLLSPSFLAIGFVLALGCAFWSIWRNREIDNQNAIRGYMQSAIQNAKIRLESDENYLDLLSRELTSGILTPPFFDSHVPSYLEHHPGLLNIAWISPDFQIEHMVSRDDEPSPPASQHYASEARQIVERASKECRPFFTPLRKTSSGEFMFELWAPAFKEDPTFKEDRLLGFFVGLYSCNNLIKNSIPKEVQKNYCLAFETFRSPQREGMDFPEAIDNKTIKTSKTGEATAYIPLSGKGFGITLSKKTGNFAMHLVLISAFCVIIAVGIALLLIRQSQDLNQRKKIESELVNAKKAAEEASNQKGRFLASMSHEIRTPMTAILGYLDLIADSCPRRCEFADKEIHGYIDAVQRNGHHLMELINSILDLSKIEAGKIEILNEPCSLPEIISDVVMLTHPVAERKRLTVTAELLTEIPELVRTDAFRLRQILVNLIGNAIKFTQKGSITIKVGMAKGNANPYRKVVFIKVKDTGIGIPCNRMHTLFAPFSQADSSTDRTFGGTGLGLTISRMLARMLGGDITAKSIDGKGSTFTLSITVGIPDNSDMLKKLVLSMEQKQEQLDKKPQKLHSRILLAEDGIDNQRLISTLLCKLGAEVTIADDGQKAVEEAVEAWENHSPYDLILMDMQMPILDGYEATQKLRSLGYDAPIIALTANAMSGDRQKCINAGCDDYLRKPIEPKNLFATIARFSEKVRTLELTKHDKNRYNPIS